MGKKRRRHLTTEMDVRIWVDRYESGESIRTIAAAENVSYGTVHRHLTLAGAQLRPRGRRWPTP